MSPIPVKYTTGLTENGGLKMEDQKKQ